MATYVVEKNGKYFAGEVEHEGYGSTIEWAEKESPKVLTFARKDVAEGWAKSLSANVEKE